MSKYIPMIVALLLMGGMFIVHAQMTDLYASSNISAKQLSKLFEEIPKEFNNWVGQDIKISEEVRKGAGAVGHVNRVYKNNTTGEVVTLWLIVGHSKDVCRHEPTTCYPSQGFKQMLDTRTTKIGDSQDEFFTTEFRLESDLKGNRQERVFWSWFKPEKSSDLVQWKAPSNPRLMFGNSRGLFKMYFTCAVPVSSANNDEPTKTSAFRFGTEFLPIAKAALAKASAVNAAPADAKSEVTESTKTDTKPAAKKEATAAPA